MRVGDDACVGEVVRSVGVREEAVGDEDVAGAGLDLCEALAGFDVGVDGDIFVGWVEALWVVVEGFADALL